MFLEFLIGSAMFFFVFVSLVGFYTNRVAGMAITNKFKAAEAISNGTVPEQWVKQINRHIARKSIMRRLSVRSTTPEELLNKKLDKLYQYFETCPFFESPETRQLLLDELQETRNFWIDKSWEEITLRTLTENWLDKP